MCYNKYIKERKRQVKTMTVEKAVAVSNALNDIDEFNAFTEEIERLLANDFDLGETFEERLTDFLMTEYMRRKKVLEDL